jgi:hypothetical protein
MAKLSLRKASIFCLAIWGAIWLVFMLLRFSPFDIRGIPGIGMIMLGALATALLAPLVAILLAGVALLLQPRVSANWLTLGCAVAALFGQCLLFFVTRWM